MCRVLRVARSGFYAWCRTPVSARATEDKRLLGLIRSSHVASGCIYGSPRVFDDLKEAGEHVGRKRVERLMRINRIRGVRGYKAPRFIAGNPAAAVPNLLKREFTVERPNQAWVTDITYLRTWEGWIYLAAVIDLFSRMVVGWSMKTTLRSELVLDALLMAVWRRRPNEEVLIHSDQGSQYDSTAWKKFCRDHDLVPSMSRRGNCWDNAVAESFFGSLKKEKVKKQIYPTREMARAEVFDYIEGFYNRRRRHSHLGGVSPEAYERASQTGL
jgi:putative transposase